MASTNDLALGSLKILIYGYPKTGKTRLAGTFPNPYFVDLDNGMRVFYKTPGINYVTINQKPTTDPDFMAALSQRDLQRKLHESDSMWLKSCVLIEHWANTLPEDSTIVIDSLSRWSDACIAHIKKTNGRGDMQIQDWGTFGQLFANNLQILNQIPQNVILLAHKSFEKDEKSGEIAWLPSIPGKTSTTMGGYFDDVWLAEADTPRDKAPEYYITVDPQKRTACGSRLGLSGKIVNPTYEKIKTLIEKGRK